MTRTALRNQNWVLIPPYSGSDKNSNTNIESGIADDFQLYNLNIDISQQNNLATSNPKKLNEMIKRYEYIIGIK